MLVVFTYVHRTKNSPTISLQGVNEPSTNLLRGSSGIA